MREGASDDRERALVRGLAVASLVGVLGLAHAWSGPRVPAPAGGPGTGHRHDLAAFTVRPGEQGVWIADVSSLGWGAFVGSGLGRPPIVLRRGDERLIYTHSPEWMRRGGDGRYGLFGDELWFTTVDGSSPLEHLDAYTLELHPERRWALVPEARGTVTVLVLAHLYLAVAWRIRPGAFPRSYRAALLVALAALLIGRAAPRFHLFRTSPDTWSYVQPWDERSYRTPGYPWFVAATTDAAEARATVRQVPTDRFLDDRPDAAFLPVVRTQKVLLGLAVLALASVLTGVVPPPLVAAGLLLALGHGVLGKLADHAVTECLAEAALLAACAALLAHLAWGRARSLVTLGACVGLMALIRPDGIYGFVLLAGAGIGPLVGAGRAAPDDDASDDDDAGAERPGARRTLRARLGALALAGALAALGALGPRAYRAAAYGERNPGYFYLVHEASRALHFAEADDLPRIDDPRARSFLERAMERRDGPDGVEARGADGRPTPYHPHLLHYVYRIVGPLSGEMTSGRHERQAMLGEVVDAVRGAHHLQITVDALRALAVALRSSRPTVVLGLPPAALAAIFVLGSALAVRRRRAWAAIAALTLLAAHVAHLAIVARFSEPISRLVGASEVLVWLGGCVLVAAAAPGPERAGPGTAGEGAAIDGDESASPAPAPGGG